MKFIILILSLICISNTWASQGKLLNIDGLLKTDRRVVELEAQLTEPFTAENLEQNLLRTGLFSQVTVTENDSEMSVTVVEKWTTIPIFKVNSGGGVNQWVLGVYDPHLAGQRVELGYQYEQLSSAPSQVAWLKIPRLFQSRWILDTQFWDIQRIRLKYNPEIANPQLTKAFLLKTQRNYFSLGYEFVPQLQIRGSVEQRKDRFSTDLVSRNLIDQVPGQVLPEDTSTLLLGLQFDWQDFQYEKTKQYGKGLSFLARKGENTSGPNDSFYLTQITGALFHKLKEELLFAQRLQIGTSDSETLQFWNYLGGLESIRGFRDNRFVTRNYWLSNSEVRWEVSRRHRLKSQVISFVDIAGIDEGSRDLKNAQAASFGIGTRAILPQFYRLTLRLDYAVPILSEDDENLSFGIQQFF